ncbi:hypothetical protein FRC05_010532 [Tulasnella sp. 425]|nr:hypothetical protein FRC05_010532 [Tulasnella sp. 425]
MNLLYCDADDIRFLSTILEDVKAISGDADTRSIERKGMNTVKTILDEALGGYRDERRQDDISGDESRNAIDLECVGDLEDVNDETWTEEWEILDQAQAIYLEGDEECGHIVEKLESRLSDLKTTKGTSGRARGEETLQDEEPESTRNSSPISLLPVELLQHIFRLTALSRHWVRIPLVLSHVNSHFRTIVLGIPSLWTVLDDSLSMPIVELYATQSGDEPLVLSFRTDYLFGKSSHSAQDWFDFLSRESARVERVTVVGTSPQGVSSWGRRFDGYADDELIIFPSLTTLVISLSTDSHDRALCPTWSHFPFLRELWIQGCWCPGWVGPQDPFPPTLRHLRLSQITSAPLTRILEALSGVLGLVGLALADCTLDLEEAVPPLSSRVTLACLDELEFERVRAADMSTISLYLSTPNLSSLSITYPLLSGGTADFPIPFTVAHPQISSLRILDCRLTSNEWGMALRNLDNLANLHIRASSLTDGDLSMLEEGTVAPQLVHITFENELDLTTSFIERVVRAHPNVESVVLRGWAANNVSQGVVETISKLVRHVIVDVSDGVQQENENGSEEGYASSSDESYWEGSDFEEDDGWLSGDQEVVARAKVPSF